MITRVQKNRIVAGYLSLSLLLNSPNLPSFADDEYFGDTSISVGSINTNIFASPLTVEQEKLRAQQRIIECEKLKNDQSDKNLNEVEKLLNYIPSWKYYKIIGREYSKRSSGYSCEDNLMMPLM